MAVVCLSGCPIPDHKLRMEGRSKLEIGWKEAHDTGDPCPHLEVERSKVKVTRSQVIASFSKRGPQLLAFKVMPAAVGAI